MSNNRLKGFLGFKGETGYSAYEIAVKNGYKGTEEEWLQTLDIKMPIEGNISENSSNEKAGGAKAVYDFVNSNVEKLKQELATKDSVNNNVSNLEEKIVTKKSNSDFSVLEGEIPGMKASYQVPWPEGFNYDNCVVVSSASRFTPTAAWIFYNITPSDNSTACYPIPAIKCGPNNILLGNLSADALYYKIVLMKI